SGYLAASGGGGPWPAVLRAAGGGRPGSRGAPCGVGRRGRPPRRSGHPAPTRRGQPPGDLPPSFRPRRLELRDSCPEDLDVVLVQHGSAVVVLDEVYNLAQHLVGMPAVVADASHPDRQRLPAVQVSHLGDRHVEAAPDLLHQRTAHLAFSLEAVICRQLEDELEGAHNHLCLIGYVTTRQRLMASRRGSPIV